MRSFILFLSLASVPGCLWGWKGFAVDTDVPCDTDAGGDTDIVDTNAKDTDAGYFDGADDAHKGSSQTYDDKPCVMLPALQVSYTTAASGYGDWDFKQGGHDVNFGGFQFKANVPLEVKDIVIQGYVADTPGLGVFYMSGADGDIMFANHFVNCVLRDSVSGSVIMGPIDPTSAGVLDFTDDFSVDSSLSPIMNLMCDHTGLAPAGDFDGFAVDIDAETSIYSLTETGEAVDASLVSRNGGDNPGTARILRP